MKKKINSGRHKHILAASLACVMAFSMTACGGSGQTQSGSTDAQTDGYVWVPEYVDLPEGTDAYNGVIRGDVMYVVSNNWDDDGNQTDTTFEQISLTDGSATELFRVDRTQTETEEGGSTYRYSNFYDVTDDGCFVTADSAYGYNEQTGESATAYYLCRYSAAGELESEIDITADVDPDGSGSGYVQRMMLDGEGRICVALENAILLYDADGSSLGKISVDTTNGWIEGMVRGSDGQPYFTYYDYSSNMQLRRIDFDTKSADTVYENLLSNCNYLTAGASETELIIGTDSAVYRYDMTTQTSEELFQWLDCDIYGSYVCGFGRTSDGKLLVVLNDWETDGYELATLTQTEASQVTQKTQIVIGAFYEDSGLSRQIVKFNKSNDQYHVTLKTYMDYSTVETEEDYNNATTDAYTRLNNEITSAECPDLMLLDSLNVAQLAAKGVFEDLTSYLENSTVLNREDYFDNALEAYTYEDQLIAIPQSFYLMTIIGKTSDVGEEPGWTLDELMAYANEHPDAQIFDYNTKSSMLQNLISHSQSKYIDWESGKCFFDSEDFAKVLEFANSFPDEYSYDEDEPSTPIKLASGQTLLDLTTIYSADEMQLAEAMYGEPVTYIGFPNEDGTSGTYLSCSNAIAITAKSENKDAAWSFLESYLTAADDYYSYGFSSRTEQFEEQLASTMTSDYTDENGDPILNEDGLALTGGGMSYNNDWSYDYRVTTEEEAALLRNLIENAQPTNAMDEQILSIITEEADSYFSGDKSAADAAAVIQSRVQIYVNEHM